MPFILIRDEKGLWSTCSVILSVIDYPLRSKKFNRRDRMARTTGIPAKTYPPRRKYRVIRRGDFYMAKRSRKNRLLFVRKTKTTRLSRGFRFTKKSAPRRGALVQPKTLSCPQQCLARLRLSAVGERFSVNRRSSCAFGRMKASKSGNQEIYSPVI